MAASVASLGAIGVTSGRLVSGFLLDRFHAPRVIAAIFVLGALGLSITAALPNATPGLFLVGALAGRFALGAEGDIIPFMIRRYAGMRHCPKAEPHILRRRRRLRHDRHGAAGDHPAPSPTPLARRLGQGANPRDRNRKARPSGPALNGYPIPPVLDDPGQGPHHQTLLDGRPVDDQPDLPDPGVPQGGDRVARDDALVGGAGLLRAGMTFVAGSAVERPADLHTVHVGESVSTASSSNATTADNRGRPITKRPPLRRPNQSYLPVLSLSHSTSGLRQLSTRA